MITANGRIEITTHYNPLTSGIERYDFKWSGGPIVQMSGSLLIDTDRSRIKCKYYPPRMGDVIWFGPFQLKVIEWNWGCDYFTLIRVDSLFGYLRYYWHRFCKLLDLIYRRLIITAVVWNCASHDTGVSVSWRDLYLIQALQKLKNKKENSHVV